MFISSKRCFLCFFLLGPLLAILDSQRKIIHKIRSFPVLQRLKLLHILQRKLASFSAEPLHLLNQLLLILFRPSVSNYHLHPQVAAAQLLYVICFDGEIPHQDRESRRCQHMSVIESQHIRCPSVYLMQHLSIIFTINSSLFTRLRRHFAIASPCSVTNGATWFKKCSLYLAISNTLISNIIL